MNASDARIASFCSESLARDVHRRIRLGESLRLRFLQRLVVAPALLRHLREDEVARAVDDAEQRVDAVGDQPALERIDDRNPAAGGGFEGDAGVLLARELEELRAFDGEQRFVRGDDRFAAP